MEALGYYRTALAIRPDAALIHNRLGLIYSDQHHMDEAIDHFRQAVRLVPSAPWAHNNLGVALAGRAGGTRPIDDYREALRLDPNLCKAHHNLGEALQVEGRLDEAIEESQKALGLDPKSSWQTADSAERPDAAARTRGPGCASPGRKSSKRIRPSTTPGLATPNCACFSARKTNTTAPAATCSLDSGTATTRSSPSEPAVRACSCPLRRRSCGRRDALPTAPWPRAGCNRPSTRTSSSPRDWRSIAGPVRERDRPDARGRLPGCLGPLPASSWPWPSTAGTA